MFVCPTKFWKCENGRCISDNLVCDGDFHCSDESDEKNCKNWTCVSGFIKCADQMECVKVMFFKYVGSKEQNILFTPMITQL